jgi:hypothetical protein
MKNRILQNLSPAYFLQIVKSTFKFAPLSSAISLLITILLLIVVEGKIGNANEKIVANIVLTLGLGFIYFLNIRIYSFIKKIPLKIEVIVSAIVAALLIFFYSTLPDKFRELDMIRFAVLTTAGLIFLLWQESVEELKTTTTLYLYFRYKKSLQRAYYNY